MEIEYKFEVAKIESYREKALSIGFVSAKTKNQTDTYFLANDRDANNREIYLRIRQDSTKTKPSLDYSTIINDAATEEIETEIDDKQNMQAILEALGYKVKCVVHKKRETLKKDDISIMFDTIENLGHFVEIEILGDAADEQRVIKTAKELGLENSQRIVGAGYPTLLLSRTKQQTKH